MALHIPNAAYDAYFAYFSACTRQDLLSTTDNPPTNLTSSLSNVAMASGDFSVGDGTPNGRRLTVAAKTGVAVTAPGTVRKGVLSLGGTIRFVTPVVTERTVTTDDQVNMGTYYIQVAAPTAP